jgi:hypothetical protein
VDPAPDPLLLRKSGIAGNRTRNSGSVAKNSDHYTTEAVFEGLSGIIIQKKEIFMTVVSVMLPKDFCP